VVNPIEMAMMSKIPKREKFKPRRWKVLAQQIEAKGWTHGAELGVYKGMTLIYQLARFKELHMLAVDTWTPHVQEADVPSPEGFRSYEEDDLDAYLQTIQRRIAELDAVDRCEIMRMTTDRAADFVAPQSIDFVFIDADHTYEGVKNDILRWAPKIREGGMLLGHDANNPPFPGVNKALDELLPGWEAGHDHTWMIEIEKVNNDLA